MLLAFAAFRQRLTPRRTGIQASAAVTAVLKMVQKSVLCDPVLFNTRSKKVQTEEAEDMGAAGHCNEMVGGEENVNTKCGCLLLLLLQLAGGKLLLAPAHNDGSAVVGRLVDVCLLLLPSHFLPSLAPSPPPPVPSHHHHRLAADCGRRRRSMACYMRFAVAQGDVVCVWTHFRLPASSSPSCSPHSHHGLAPSTTHKRN